MKVLVVIPAIGPIYGGPSKSVIELTQALGKLGISVDLVTTNANGTTNLAVPLYTWINQDFYRLQYFDYWGLGDYKFSWTLMQWLFREVSNYDIVHINAIFSIPNLFAYWACLLGKIPYVVAPRGMLEPWALSYKAIKKGFYYTFLEKPALNRASALQMLSSSEAERTKSLNLKSPFVIVPNGVHSQDFDILPDPNIFYQKFPATRNKTLLLFLGRIDPKKGLDILATAFSQIHSQFPNTHLIIAGPDNINFMDTAKNYFVEAGCEQAVTFTGMLTGKLKYAVLSAATLYVAPSYSEGFSISILEGMASGLPCVFTTECNFPEAEEVGAAKIVKPEADQFASACLDCLENPESAKIMGQKARELIFGYYTWDKIAVRMQQVYLEIINQRN